MKRIAVTGGIGTGKTLLTDYLAEKYTVVDTDVIAHAITAPGGKAIPLIRSRFGEEVLAPDGSMDRKKMAAIVYQDAEKRRDLEEIQRRIIFEESEKQLRAAEERGEPAAFLAAPLLFEQGMEKHYDEVWLITADRETRIGRVMKRDGRTREEVLRILDAQLPEEEKMKRADRVFHNDGTPETLFREAEETLVLSLKSTV